MEAFVAPALNPCSIEAFSICLNLISFAVAVQSALLIDAACATTVLGVVSLSFDGLFCCSWKLFQLLQLVWTLFFRPPSREPSSRYAAQSRFANCGANGISCGYSEVFRWSAFISLHMSMAGSPPVVLILAGISLAELHVALLCFA